MSETYQIYAPNSIILQVDKGTNKIHLTPYTNIETGKYTEEYSKALLQAWQIMEEAKKQYKPLYLDPSLKTNPNHFKEFQSFRNLYLKDPIKKAIAPWTKKEKAYYESLQTKRERYQYLVIRSGLRSAVIDIPFDAIGGVDEKGRVINKEYEDIFYQVDRNKDTLKSEFFATEWGIAAGILGNPEYFASDLTGFTARYVQSTILYIQLNPKIDYRGILKIIEIYGKDYVGSFRTFKSGLRKNPLRQQQLTALAKSIKPDRFGMLPYIDEIMGVDWVMDLNMLYGYAIDGDGYNIEAYIKEIDEGKLLDPRDPKSTKQTRLEFRKRIKSIPHLRRYHLDFPNDWTQKKVDLYIDSMLLEAKIMAVTPPQGYPNAPTYYIPEYLDELYEAGKLDKLLNPTIPAIYRESFPQELRDKIEWYAKKHHIK
ncbi:hypothetical protein LS77_010645 [Helicobacter bilis]|uniref:Thioredoxin reductase n=3 Tax=Helicobacter bilis TaxID=37372 RepID=A0A6D2C3T8_9HELI|nr:hypothetical protein [Helicobacter bilis]EMZ35904.1 hypothetical protein C826_02430 [Helicobacter bilis WiWa]TLE02411.1 hypothetical protein LS77_010645 [Helicobacter bilis]TLE03157.1 hypothetical protein LS76_010515 [Helicobacter bilis]